MAHPTRDTAVPRIVYAGTPEFAVPPLEALIQHGLEPVAVYTQPDRPAGRGRQRRPSPVKTVAVATGLPVLQPEELKSAGVQAEFAALKPDLLIVVAYGLILPRAILEIPGCGAVNLHASLLPRWRGAAPIHRAILANDPETGVCLMQMAPGLDTGPVHVCHREPITPTTTSGELHERLSHAGTRLLLEHLPALLAGTSQPRPQEEAAATYAHKVDKAEAWLDWSQPAAVLDRRIRAFNPWPIAQARLDDDRIIRIHAAEPLPGEPDPAPGTIRAADAEGIEVGTGAGRLRLQTLQLPGKRPIAARDWANTGDRVGQVLLGKP